MKKIAAIAFMVINIFAFGLEDAYQANGSFGVVSNYIYRGVSQSNDLPAAQGTLSATYGNLYLGGFGSNVNMLSSSNVTATSEFDGYMGLMGPIFGGFGFNVGYIKYMFPEAWTLTKQEAYLGVRYLHGFSFSSGLIAFYDIDTNAMTNYEGQAEYDFGPLAFSLKLGSFVDKRYYGSFGIITHLADFEVSASYKLAEDVDANKSQHQYFVYRLGKSF